MDLSNKPALFYSFVFVFLIGNTFSMLLESQTIGKITSFVRELSVKEQKELLKAFEYRQSLKEAQRLNKSVKKNTVTISEITAIVNQTRNERRRNA